MKCTLRFLYWILFASASPAVMGQQTAVRQNLNILQRGFCDNGTKGCAQRQINFFKACGELGDLYCKRKEFDAALKYYLMASEINDHVYIQTYYANRLQVSICTKASSILLDKKHTHEDSALAFRITYRFLTTFSRKELVSLSEKYFHFPKDTFYVGDHSDLNYKPFFLFAINPLFVTDETTLSKISNRLSGKVAHAKSIKLFLGCMDFPGTELNNSYFFHSLFYIRDSLQHHFPKINFTADVGFSSQTVFPEIGSFISFPVLEVTPDP